MFLKRNIMENFSYFFSVLVFTYNFVTDTNMLENVLSFKESHYVRKSMPKTVPIFKQFN